jgi:hypothetical protein
MSTLRASTVDGLVRSAGRADDARVDGGAPRASGGAGFLAGGHGGLATWRHDGGEGASRIGAINACWSRSDPIVTARGYRQRGIGNEDQSNLPQPVPLAPIALAYLCSQRPVRATEPSASPP